VGEPEAPVGDDVADDRQQRDQQQHGERQQRHQHDRWRARQVLGVDVDAGEQAGRLQQLAPGAERRGGDHHPAAGERREPDPRRVEADHRALGPSDGHGVLRGDLEELGPQRAGAVERQPVEVDPVLVAGRGGAGADPDGGEPEQAMDRRGG